MEIKREQKSRSTMKVSILGMKKNPKAARCVKNKDDNTIKSGHNINLVDQSCSIISKIWK